MSHNGMTSIKNYLEVLFSLIIGNKLHIFRPVKFVCVPQTKVGKLSALPELKFILPLFLWVSPCLIFMGIPMSHFYGYPHVSFTGFDYEVTWRHSGLIGCRLTNFEKLYCHRLFPPPKPCADSFIVNFISRCHLIYCS